MSASKIQVIVQEVSPSGVTVISEGKTFVLPRPLFPQDCTREQQFFLYSLSETDSQTQVYTTAKEVLNELLGNSS